MWSCTQPGLFSWQCLFFGKKPLSVQFGQSKANLSIDALDHLTTAGEDPPLLLLEGLLLSQCIWMFDIAAYLAFCLKLVVCMA